LRILRAKRVKFEIADSTHKNRKTENKNVRQKMKQKLEKQKMQNGIKCKKQKKNNIFSAQLYQFIILH